MMTIGAVRHWLNPGLIHKPQDRTLLIRRQQRGFDRTLNTPLLSQ
ncbi:hypothetical protein ALP85_01995 [Pseudomonas syringae pv. syringae]|nr:hypothetical protein ALP85_01995 [Pseudomonas syringae pv. syringae]